MGSSAGLTTTLFGLPIISAFTSEEERLFDEPDRLLPDLRPLLPADAVILDVGCGRGRHLGSLRDQGFHPVGIDLAEEGLGVARTRHPCTVLRADLFRLPIRGGSVDALLAWQIICEFNRRQASWLLAEAHRVLVPGGLLVLAGCCGTASVPDASELRRLGYEVSTSMVPTAGPAPGLPSARWVLTARSGTRLHR